MFEYSIVQLARHYAHKLDRPLRHFLVSIYKPFLYTPCIIHKQLERWMKKMKRIPVIIQFHEENGVFALKEVEKQHFRMKIHHQFRYIPSCSAEVTPQALEQILQRHDVKKVYLNRKVSALLNNAVPSANAKNVAVNGTALSGKGVTIAIVDTGIYPHPDLEGRIAGFVDFVNGRTEPYDDNGHGTHCAGDAAGNGSVSSGLYRGPAYEANVVGVKVLNKVGAGRLDTIIRGIEWCIQYNETSKDEKIDIISLSLGGESQPFPEENDDPLVQAAEKAWDKGIVVCAAAGNAGPEYRTISSPGISDKIITVGALDDRDTAETREDDEIADFSSRGPTYYGVSKPDIVVPGVNIVSLRAPKSFLDKYQKQNRIGQYYMSMSGTSMATPICAGIVALMLQYKPDATPDEIKRALKEGAGLWKDRDPNIYGAGYIDAQRAIGLLAK
ncbi:S8 family peptidase [Parageobacillus thermoglucosidasius]|uniref:S8 family peptidase n=1 Tax=Parageobacillus thermoglucosidasius TaxID=1426 RepID=UPI002E201F6B|nr:S8 family peptidase [Parageobacillus thermoglucosidasius]MED4914913.1 S8 family peptidase [Parageobacillus thermoglucosidasius]MED4943736.1 S8 family peptidase [Parageobacillus thermoglucosidasius]MED4984196.1 S8 family peptidase [Parageobacillus thermoglucosidasius]